MSVGSVTHQARQARVAARQLASLRAAVKNHALSLLAARLRAHQEAILAANQQDVEAGARAGLGPALLDRLRLTPERIQAMATGTEEVQALPDPIGREEGWRLPNGLQIRRVRVPLGVIAMVYEARPNVTVEASTLCFKSGNACLLRGSSSARNSNAVLVQLIQEALAEADLPPESVQAVADPGRDVVDELATMTGLVDCIIPRGGHELIQRVVRTATVPVLETGVGNCHLYVHADADLGMAEAILVNGKTSRPAVCNALETLLVDRAVAGKFLPRAARALEERGVELRACPATRALLPDCRPASEQDWDTEYLDLILAVRVVEGLDQALEHIARHGTMHSEAIVTRDLEAARRFQAEVDACAVYVNASTRFTDGREFGFGAEIGISTQKMHARGPVGLEQLTSIRYLVDGQGQIRT